MNIRTAFALSIVVASALFAPVYGPAILARAASTTGEDLQKDMKSVAQAFALVEKNFADPVSSEKAFYGNEGRGGAIPGMLHTLDPHSNFVDPAEYREMQRRQHAQYYGVGMQITMDQLPGDKKPRVIVMEPFVNSPAWNAGMRRGDTIVAVDGQDCTEKDSGQVAELLRGPKGTQVKVSVKRDGSTEPYSATITRGGIETSVVDAFWLKPGIAFLHVTSFEASNIGREVEAHMQRLGEQNVQGLILDLRGNLGGLVTEAVALAGRFLRNGQTVVSHRGRAEQEQVFRAKGNPLAQKYPIVCLVNGQSASASEIVSGALQDHDRGWIMGETTFGKGLVQAQFPLSEGAALLLTIAHYYTPSGRLIQRDYSKKSFWEYYQNRNTEQPAETNDVKATDSGRKVFGGGGITPDEKYTTPALKIFQRRMGRQESANWIYRFANTYFGEKKPVLPTGWQPDEPTMERLKQYLTTQKVPFTEAEWEEHKEWLKGRVKYEFYFRAWDKATAERAQWADDPEVKKGIESLPKAQSLMAQADKVYAMRK
jgi:carboxyl-terminal processing protease